MKEQILYTSVAFVGLIILMSISGCKKCCKDPTNPACDNYDSCLTRKPNAGFNIRVSQWDPIKQEYTKELLDFYGFHDTVTSSELDIIAGTDSNNGISYTWKFDGMSTTFNP
jgi:hypothetical protein